jgi:hypothetical protein
MRIAAALLLAVPVVACTDTIGPPPPATVAATVTLPTGVAGLPLASAPSFSVRDAAGNILGGVSISVAVTSGGGSLASAPRATLDDVPTPVGAWTLGNLVGANTLTVTVANLPPLVFTVNGIPGPPASLAVVSGDGQRAIAGTQLPLPLAFQLRDKFGNGVSSREVTFVVSGGGGTIEPTSLVTDADGKVGGVIWRLGKSDVTQTGQATAAGLGTSVNAEVETQFNVDVRFFGPPPAADAEAAFLEAAARIRATIVGDIPDVDIPTRFNNAGIDISFCGVPGVVVNEIVDDVLIYASVAPIDGIDKILASANICVIRNQGRLTTIGVMKFDVVDIAGLISTGRLDDVVLHEMLHIVGFGTIWTDTRRPGGVLLTGFGTDNPRYTGSLGISACGSAGGTDACAGGVAVEGLPFGSGTADSHWRELTFNSELMTGFVEQPGIPMQFSAITIQSLADAGYSINLFSGDDYLVPPPPGAPGNQSRSVNPGDNPPWETIGGPVFEIGPTGPLRQVGPILHL